MRHSIVTALISITLPLLTVQASRAGKNAGGALIVHTNDAVSYTATGLYCGVDFDDPGTCENAVTRTDKDENTPAVIWFLAAFPDTSNPAVGVIYFGIDHNLPSGEGYFANWGYCGPAGSLQIPDAGWPESVTAGNSLAFGSPIVGDTLFPFYWFAAYGFSGAYLGTAINPTGGYAAFVDDSNPGVQDSVTKFGTVRWYATGANDCPSSGGGGDGGEGDPPDGGGEEDQWLDGDGELMWERDCILARLREDLPMPPREPVEELGIPAFDDLGRQLGLISVQRVLMLNDEASSHYPGISRMVKLRFGAGIDEVAVAQQYEQLSEVVWGHPNHVHSMEPLNPQVDDPNDPGFSEQWHLVWSGEATSCLDPQFDPGCCAECDIGLDVAWQYARGDSGVIVAFIDSGADMQHPDLFDSYLVNWGEDDGDGLVKLCADSLGGDIDTVDTDRNGHVDDILMGWRYLAPPPRETWKHPPTHHGTSVAGILGAITNNLTGVASAAGGDADPQAPRPGVRLIQFSVAEGGTATDNLVRTFTYAHEYGARIYSSSAILFVDTALTEAVDSLSSKMLFVQAAGNYGDTSITPFAKLRGVMAVGGYDCSGGRWMIPSQHQMANRGSSYGDELEVMGPAGDENEEVEYERMVLASTDKATPWPPYEYGCVPSSQDVIGCFGGTSAAAPTVASVAALIFSYAEATPDTVTVDQVRKILKYTAEDIRCDPAVDGCDCSAPDPTCAVRLLGWDRYSGFGRVDAGRALTLPVAVLDTLDLPNETYVFHGDTIHLEWEAFDINTENGELDHPDAYFQLHYLVEEDGLENGWNVIDENFPTTITSLNWVVPDTVPTGGYRRIRLTVVDSQGNTNQDYTKRFIVLGSSAGVDTTQGTSRVTIQGVAPNPASTGARIRYVLGASTDVSVRVFDVAGRLVRTLAAGEQAAGSWALDWEGLDNSGHNVPSGVYFIRLDVGSHAETVQFVRLQ